MRIRDTTSRIIAPYIDNIVRSNLAKLNTKVARGLEREVVIYGLYLVIGEQKEAVLDTGTALRVSNNANTIVNINR